VSCKGPSSGLVSRAFALRQIDPAPSAGLPMPNLSFERAFDGIKAVEA